MRVLANLMMGFTIIFMPGVVLVILFWQTPAAPSPRVTAAVDELRAASAAEEEFPAVPQNVAARSWRFCSPREATLRVHVDFDCVGVVRDKRLSWSLCEGPLIESECDQHLTGDACYTDDLYASWDFEVWAVLEGSRITLDFDTDWTSEKWESDEMLHLLSDDARGEHTINLGVLALGQTRLQLDSALVATISLESVRVAESVASR